MSLLPDFKPDETDEEKGRVLWNTEKINKALDSIENGYEVRYNPFHEQNIEWRRGNLVFEYTKVEMDEIKKCARDIIYFANKYCRVMTDDGVQNIILRDYQVNMLKQFQVNRWNVCLAPRQIGKTICSAIFLAWYLLFNFDKNAMLMANKGGTTKEIVDKTYTLFSNLPFFLKPGIVKKDVMSVKFDNNCRLIGSNTTTTGGIGFTIHLLYLDEFAHIKPTIINPFYENVYPTLSSSKISRVIVTSTPNGFNKFHEIYQGALDGNNEYVAFNVDWWEVPGRDEAWKQQEIRNLGGVEAFNEQYGCQFLSGESLLLNSTELKKLKSNEKEYVNHEFDILDDLGIDYSFLKWDPDFDIDEIDNPRKFFVMSVDIAEGVRRDYSIVNIFRVDVIEPELFRQIENPTSILDFFKLNQVGIFRCNTISIYNLSKFLYSMTVDIFDSENLRLVIEYNTYGQQLIDSLKTLYPISNDFDEEIIVKFKHRINAKRRDHGLKLVGDIKKIACQELKESIRTNRLLLSDKNTVQEAGVFSRTPSGSYEAQTGNDDSIMTCVNVCSIFSTRDWGELVEEMFDFIEKRVFTEKN